MAMEIPVNYNEDAVGRIELPPLMSGPDGSPVETAEDRDRCQIHLRQVFAQVLYGEPPASPDGVTVVRKRLPTDVPQTSAEEWRITIAVGPRSLERPAVLWRPASVSGPLPVICGLSFLGPAGVTASKSVDLDRSAVIDGLTDCGVVDGHPTEALRGRHADRWPVGLITGAGFGLLVSGYGGWVPDHPDLWRGRGLWPLLSPSVLKSSPGAIGLWAWAYSRLVDAALRLPEVDAGRLYLIGHSRLGKAALWATANDRRVAGALINNAGCGGTSLSRRDFGETLAHMTARFSHWLAPAAQEFAANPERLPIDQHQLLACVAPRSLYVASALEDLWADPRGEYLALRAAAPFWGFDFPDAGLPPLEEAFQPGNAAESKALAWHLRPGQHDLTPWDWRRFLAWLAGRQRDG